MSQESKTKLTKSQKEILKIIAENQPIPNYKIAMMRSPHLTGLSRTASRSGVSKVTVALLKLKLVSSYVEGNDDGLGWRLTEQGKAFVADQEQPLKSAAAVDTFPLPAGSTVVSK